MRSAILRNLLPGALMLAGCLLFVLVLSLDRPSFAQGTPPTVPMKALALSNTKTQLSAGPIAIHTLTCDNPSNAEAFLQIFNALSANVTVGTTTPTVSIGIQNAIPLTVSDADWMFFTGITVAATTTATGNGAPSAAINCNFATR